MGFSFWKLFSQISLASIGLNFELGYNFTDLFERTISNKILLPKDFLAVSVNPSGVVMLKATIIEPSPDDTRKTSRDRDLGLQTGGQGYLLSHMGVAPQETPREPPVPETLGGMGRDSFGLKADDE